MHMNKKILGLALSAISLVAISSNARTNPDNNTNACTAQNAGCVKTDKNTKCQQDCLFEGIDLTDAQKTQLRQLNEKRKADRISKARNSPDNKKVDSKDKNVRDNKDRAEERKMRAEERRADRKAYLAEVKKIIGADNYVIFLENMYVNGGAHHGKMAFGKDRSQRHGKMAFGKDRSRKSRQKQIQ